MGRNINAEPRALGLLEFIRETKFHAKTLIVGICEYKTGVISPIFNKVFV